MALTVKGQDLESRKLSAAKMRSRFYERENQRLRQEFRKRKFDGGIPGDVKQGDIRS